MPRTASRMTVTEYILSIGHGMRGLLPRMPGTARLLSLWENAFEGHLPEQHIVESSVLLVHANDFSCQLPRNGAVKPSSNTSLALIGNHFAKPRQLPAWISRAERPSDMFCTSNEPGK
eukprot:5079648-Amphidinium_carterae.1